MTDRRFNPDPTLHQGMVHACARKFCRAGEGPEYDDLVQAGNEGLLHAGRKYDISKGWAFNTYAQWWVRAYMQKHRAGLPTVRVPGTSRILAKKRGQDIHVSVGEFDDSSMVTATSAEVFCDAPSVERALVRSCNHAERKAIRRIFFQEKTMADVAEELGCTREWVRQLRNSALAKMRMELSDCVSGS